jgi:hypothetical protein
MKDVVGFNDIAFKVVSNTSQNSNRFIWQYECRFYNIQR